MMLRRQATVKTVAIAIVVVILLVGTIAFVVITSQPGRSANSSSSSTSSGAPSKNTSRASTSESIYPANESFQFVQASVGNLSGSVAINATFRSNLQAPSSVGLVGIAYPAETENAYGINDSIECCPLTMSYSQTGAVTSSDTVDAGALSEFSSTLLLPSLNGAAYLVKLYVTSSTGTLLSPVSDVFLQIAGGKAYGGQAGAGATFFDSDNGLLYVADSGVDAVSVVNGSTGSLVATVSLPDIIGRLQFYLYDPGNHELYVGSQDSPEVYAIDTSTNFIVSKLVTSTPGQSLWSMVYDPLGGKIFGINYVNSGVSVFNDSTDKLVANITSILAPGGGIYDAKSDQIIASSYNGTTFTIDAATDTIVGRVPISGDIFLYDSDNGLLYAYEGNFTTGESIVAFDASTFQPVGPVINASGSFEFYDSFNKDIYLYSGQSEESVGGDLIAVSTSSNSIVAKISVPGLSAGLVEEEPSFLVDPTNGDIYATEVTNTQNYTIGLLHISANSNTIISQTFPPKLPLNDISFDAKDGMLYGAYGDDSSTIFRLNLASGSVNAIVVGTVQEYALVP